MKMMKKKLAKKSIVIRKPKPILKLELGAKDIKDIFMLFLALNTMGYNDENNEKGMHQIRKKARKILKERNWDKEYSYFKKILKKADPWYLIREVLKNKKHFKKNKTPAYYFNSNFKKFSQELLAEKIWTSLKKYYVEENKKLFPVFKKETTKILKFINKSPKDLKKIILMPNLLDAYWRGYGMKIKNIGYIIVGPGAEKNHGELIRHELLHIISPNYNIPKNLLLKKDHNRAAKLGYIGYNILKQEYIILILNLLYESEILKKDIVQAIIREKRYFPYLQEVIDIIKKRL